MATKQESQLLLIGGGAVALFLFLRGTNLSTLNLGALGRSTTGTLFGKPYSNIVVPGVGSYSSTPLGTSLNLSGLASAFSSFLNHPGGGGTTPANVSPNQLIPNIPTGGAGGGVGSGAVAGAQAGAQCIDDQGNIVPCSSLSGGAAGPSSGANDPYSPVNDTIPIQTDPAPSTAVDPNAAVGNPGDNGSNVMNDPTQSADPFTYGGAIDPTMAVSDPSLGVIGLPVAGPGFDPSTDPLASGVFGF